MVQSIDSKDGVALVSNVVKDFDLAFFSGRDGCEGEVVELVGDVDDVMGVLGGGADFGDGCLEFFIDEEGEEVFFEGVCPVCRIDLGHGLIVGVAFVN